MVENVGEAENNPGQTDSKLRDYKGMIEHKEKVPVCIDASSMRIISGIDRPRKKRVSFGMVENDTACKCSSLPVLGLRMYGVTSYAAFSTARS